MLIKFCHQENAYDVTLNFLKALDKNTQKNTGRKLTMLLIIVISVWWNLSHLNFYLYTFLVFFFHYLKKFLKKENDKQKNLRVLNEVWFTKEYQLFLFNIEHQLCLNPKDSQSRRYAHIHTYTYNNRQNVVSTTDNTAWEFQAWKHEYVCEPFKTVLRTVILDI